MQHTSFDTTDSMPTSLDTESVLSESDMILGVKTEGYRRMDLTEESESDKDLIIDSLNESLQIHKEIVERVQQEKDDLEYYYEQTMREQAEALEREKQQAEQTLAEAETTRCQLERTYRSLVAECEAKELEYERMESRFDAHVHANNLFHQPLSLTESQIRSMLSHMESVAQSLSIDRTVWIQKTISDVLIASVFDTAIHPGVSLNAPFGAIYRWVAKRNRSWASRIRQQITLFVVQQSKEEIHQIQLAEQAVMDHMIRLLNLTDDDDDDNNKDELKTILDLAIHLNKVIKCQEDEAIKILHVEPDAPFDSDCMVSMNPSEHIPLRVAFMISPAFVAHSFTVPAKVMCVCE